VPKGARAGSVALLKNKRARKPSACSAFRNWAARKRIERRGKLRAFLPAGIQPSAVGLVGANFGGPIHSRRLRGIGKFGHGCGYCRRGGGRGSTPNLSMEPKLWHLQQTGMVCALVAASVCTASGSTAGGPNAAGGEACAKQAKQFEFAGGARAPFDPAVNS